MSTAADLATVPTVAALYVQTAHPPCARWSRLAAFTQARFGYKIGDDGGCFEAALLAVRTFGGVLEHPACSRAWARFGLPKPITAGGWTLALDGGASCYVEQGRYGLPVKKATWLYAYGVDLRDLAWGRTPDSRGAAPNGPHDGLALAPFWREHRHDGMRSATPPGLRDELLAMARTARATAEASS